MHNLFTHSVGDGLMGVRSLQSVLPSCVVGLEVSQVHLGDRQRQGSAGQPRRHLQPTSNLAIPTYCEFLKRSTGTEAAFQSAGGARIREAYRYEIFLDR